MRTEAEDLGGLVDALLAAGEPAAVWRSRMTSRLGSGPVARLAEAVNRLTSHPADGMAVHFKLADAELETTGRRAYTRAAALLKKARRAADAAGRRGRDQATMRRSPSTFRSLGVTSVLSAFARWTPRSSQQSSHSQRNAVLIPRLLFPRRLTISTSAVQPQRWHGRRSRRMPSDCPLAILMVFPLSRP